MIVDILEYKISENIRTQHPFVISSRLRAPSNKRIIVLSDFSIKTLVLDQEKNCITKKNQSPRQKDKEID